MNQEKDLFPLIEGYLKGSLTAEQRSAFEQEMVTNITLQQQVEVSRLGQVALMRHKLYDVKNLSETIHGKEKKALKIKIAFVATGLLLLATGASYVLLNESKAPIKVSIAPVQTTRSETPATLPIEKVPIVSPPHEKPNVVPKEATTRVTAPSSVEEKPIVAPLSESKANPPIAVTITAPVHQAIEPSKNQEATLFVDPCAHVAIEAHVVSEPPCIQEQNGRITLSGFKGGQAPYRSVIFDETAQEVASSRLGAGVYTAIVTDRQNCKKKITDIQLKEIECKKDFELNIGNGEIVEVEIAATSGHLAVYDKGGNLYFYQGFYQGDKIQWNGISTHGEQLNGYFLFQINYQDGKMRRGSITVIR